MEIVPYSEIPDKEQLMPLMYHGHGFALDHRSFAERVKLDARYGEGCVGFAAIDTGRVVGYAGVLIHRTRTVKGVENAGGISMVVTHPGAVRRGICTTLFEAAHAYFRGLSFKFAFLTTSRSWHAYDLYVRLGYQAVKSVASRPTAYRLFPARTLASPASQAAPAQPIDLARVEQLFVEMNAGRTGFAVRHPSLTQVAAMRGRIDLAQSVLLEDGYAIVASGQRDGIEVREMVAGDASAQKRLLDALRERTAGFVIDPLVATKDLLAGYEREGYRLENGAHGVLMAKALAPDVTLGEAYGDEFYMTMLEWF